eukprot:1004782_1
MHCPYINNICVYNQQFRVFDKADQFSFNDHTNSQTQYKNMLQSKIWNQNEYKLATCAYSHTTHHIILANQHPTNLNEWYMHTISQLFHLHHNHSFTKDVRLYCIECIPSLIHSAIH